MMKNENESHFKLKSIRDFFRLFLFFLTAQHTGRDQFVYLEER